MCVHRAVVTSSSNRFYAHVPVSVTDQRRVQLVAITVTIHDNVAGHINEVTLRQARLVAGWVTVCGQVNHLGT